MSYIQPRLFDVGPEVNDPATPGEAHKRATQGLARKAWEQSWVEDSPRVQRAVQNATEVVASRRPAIAVPPRVGSRVVMEGFRNLHETGRGSGSTDTGLRRDYEEDYHGYPQDATGPERPVYGYMRPGTDPNQTPGGEGDVIGQYGRAVFNIDPNHLRHTTVTYGDSLSRLSTAEPAEQIASGDVPISHVIARTGRLHQPNYIEAQFHKRPSMGDVTSIDTYGPRGVNYRVRGSGHHEENQDIKDIHYAAEEAGIPYQHHTPLGTTTQGSMISHEDERVELARPRGEYPEATSVGHWRTASAFDPRDPFLRLSPQFKRLTGTDRFWGGEGQEAP